MMEMQRVLERYCVGAFEGLVQVALGSRAYLAYT